jgi:Zn-dependent protease
MYFPKGQLELSKPGEFSTIEIKHITISMIALTIAFTFALSGNNIFNAFASGKGFQLNLIPFGLSLSILGITTAFFSHEISHKFVAQKYGLWAEYRLFPKGIGLALLFGFLIPYPFAAPGAVMFRGESRTWETGRIAMAGPLANILIASITLPLYLFVFFEDKALSFMLGYICLINTVLATFNLFPLGPLDGIKVIKWNPTVWIIMLIVSMTLLVLIMQKFSLDL